MPTWETTSDWDSAQSESNVSHSDELSADSSKIQHEMLDGFEDGDFSQDPPWTKAEGTNWTVTSGYVDIESTSSMKRLAPSNFSSIVDFQCEFEIRFPSLDHDFADSGIYFRYQDTNNYCFVRTGGGGDNIALSCYDSGTKVSIGSSTASRNCASQWAEWRITVEGNSYKIETRAPGGTYSTDVDTTDSTITSSGGIGLMCNPNDKTNDYGANFDNYQLRVLSDGTLTSSKKTF